MTMPRPCTLCSHARHDDLDAAILNNEPYQNIAKRFGASMVAVLNHRGHLSGTLGASAATQETATALDVLAQMKSIQENCFTLLEVAEGANELRTVFSAVGQVRRNLETLGELTDQLRRDHKARA
jgi:hypothetical protein